MTTRLALETCAVASCGNETQPGKTWCPEHEQLFRAIGRPAVPDAPVRVPAYIQPFMTKRREGSGDPPAAPPPLPPVPRKSARPAKPSRAQQEPETCEIPGCTRPRHVTSKRSYRFCQEHLWPVGRKRAPKEAQPPRYVAEPYLSRRWCNCCHRLLTVDNFDVSKDGRFGVLNFTCRACDEPAEGLG